MTLETYQEARWNAVENHGCKLGECFGCGQMFENLAERAEHEAWECDKAEQKMRVMAAGYM